MGVMMSRRRQIAKKMKAKKEQTEIPEKVTVKAEQPKTKSKGK